MALNSEAKTFFKECVKSITLNKYNYMDKIKESADYIRLSKIYDNLDELIYLAEDKIDEIAGMKKLIREAVNSFSERPDYGLVKFYLQVKHKGNIIDFLSKYGSDSLRNLIEREIEQWEFNDRKSK